MRGAMNPLPQYVFMAWCLISVFTAWYLVKLRTTLLLPCVFHVRELRGIHASLEILSGKFSSHMMNAKYV